MKRSLKTKLTTILLSLAMFLTLMPITTNTISADDVKTTKIMLNTDGTASNLIGAQTSSIYFGNYKQSSNGPGGYYNDPIKWIVLSNTKNSETNKQELFLLSDMLLDCKAYQTSRISTTWETSYIRNWLNNTNADDSFINTAFNSKEQSYIIQSEVINNNNPYFETDGGKDTKDKLFLLSIDEVDDIEDVNGEVDASAYGFTNPKSRMAKATYYAKKQGDYDVNHYTLKYWLRSPGVTEKIATYVDDRGYTAADGEAVDKPYGVRPAFKIDVASILFTSDVNGGKAQSSLGLDEISETDTNEWKLTLLDTTRGFSVTQTNPQTDPYKPNDVLKFEYETTNTGTNDYISAILTDNSGNALYYGRLLKPSSDTGDLEVTIPSNIFEGNYILHLFSEQYNGGDNDDNKQADYASSFSTISLTVERDTPVTHEVTYIIVNGALSDGTSTTVTETVNHGSSPTQIPTGMIADENYEDGEWDIDPINAKITTNTTFRYIFARKKIRSIHINEGSASNLKGAQEDSIYFGNYYQSSDEFKEPIKWRILENDSKTLFLLSDQNLDVKEYQDSGQATTSWEKCTLRQWLNGIGDYTQDSFIKNAFNSDEQAIITETTVINDDNPTYFTPGGNITQDKLFLLSYKEVLETKYGFVNNSEATQTRVATNTKYAADRSFGTSPEGKANNWWLRSPGHTSSNMLFVGNTGRYHFMGTHGHDTNTAVRPAFKIDVASILFTSDINGGKAQNSLGLNEVSRVYTNDWKLTLLDTTRGFSATQTNSQTDPYKPDDVLTFEYENANTGKNDYISAILADNSGNVLYYGRLLKPSSDTGDLEITIPSNLSTGSYKIHVFSEQYNGGDNDTTKSTDYASNFSTISFDVKAPSYQVTYKVVNGTFDDGSTSTTEIVEHGKKPSSIPTDLNPNEDYETGSWSPDPTNATITKPTTFTYTFVKKADPIVINTIDLTITPPVAGANIVGYEQSGNWVQNPRPEIKIPDNSNYYLVNGETYWVDYSTEYGQQVSLFNGTFAENQYYYLLVQFKPNTGYEFLNDGSDILNVTNGELVTIWGGDGKSEIEYLLKVQCPPNQTTHTVTYNIVNGTLSDGTSTSTTETVEHGKKPSNIPTGMKASEGYEGGSWNPDPSTTSITEDTIFTYSFESITLQDTKVYTVTLDPGMGEGTPIVLRSDEQWYESTSVHGSDVPWGYFYRYLGDGNIWFRLPDLPNTFIAPDDYLFDTWNASIPGVHYPISGDVTFTALWKKGSNFISGVKYKLSPTSYTITQPGYTDIDCVFTSLELDIIKENGKRADYISLYLNAGILSDEKGNEISFLADDGHESPEDYKFLGGYFTSSRQRVTVAVYIDPNDYLSASPGTYTGKYKIDSIVNGIRSLVGPSRSIKLTLTIPETYTVTYSVVGGTLSNGSTSTTETVNHGDSLKQIPTEFIANKGYKGGSWNIDPSTSTITQDTEFIYTFDETPVSDPPISYSYASGSTTYTKGSNTPLNFVVDRSENDNQTFERFVGIKVDDNDVDTSNYEAVSGSVKLTLKSSYLESLSVGNHTLTTIFDDGEVKTSFTIKEQGGNNNNSYNIPKTGIEK